MQVLGKKSVSLQQTTRKTMKNTLIQKALFVCLSTLLLTSCHPEKQAIKELETLNERIYHESANWSQADWDDATQHFGELVETIAQYDDRYTALEKKDNFDLEQSCYNMLSLHIQ